jgi:hypothetical protein
MAKKKSNQLSEREIERRRKQAAEAAAEASAEAEKSGAALDTKSGGKPVQPTKAKEFRHQGR